MNKQSKYSPRFMVEIVKAMPAWADYDFTVVHREVFEDSTYMFDKANLLLSHYELSEPSYAFRIRVYRLTRIKNV